MAKFIALSETVRFKKFANVMLALSCSVPEIYIVGVITYKLFANRFCIQQLYQKVCRICIKREDEDYTRMLPERMVNVDECAALLADPMEVRVRRSGEC